MLKMHNTSKEQINSLVTWKIKQKGENKGGLEKKRETVLKW